MHVSFGICVCLGEVGVFKLISFKAKKHKFNVLVTPLSQDPLKWEHSTRTPGSVQWGPGTCPQHETIKFEVRQIPSSEIIECDRFLHVF